MAASSSPRPTPVDLSPLSHRGEAVPAEKVVDGGPIMTGFRAAYENPAAGFYTGVWESGPGTWRVAYDEDELCVVLEGQVRLTAEDGSVTEHATGEAFVVPSGFRGTWTSIGDVRKIYAIRTP